MTRHLARLAGLLFVGAGLAADTMMAAPARPAPAPSAARSRSAAVAPALQPPVAGWPPDPTDPTFRADVHPAERWAVRAVGRAAADAVLLLHPAAAVAPARNAAGDSGAGGRSGNGSGTGGPRGKGGSTDDLSAVDRPDRATDLGAAPQQSLAVVGGNNPLRTVAVFVRGETDDELWREAAEGLRAGLPIGVELVRRTGELSAGAGRPPAGEVGVGIALRDRRTTRPLWSQQVRSSGRVEAVVVAAGGTRTVESRYEEKPWAEDFDRFAAGPDGRRWIVARTDRPCATRDEAERQAIATAASRLEARVASSGYAPNGPGQPTGVHARSLSALSNGRFVADRQVRRFTRAYGDVWDAAILVDASDDTLRALAGEARSYAQSRRAERLGVGFAVLSAVVMIAVIGVLYAVVNAITRGYLAGRLRVLAIVTAAGGLLLMLTMLA